jgi:hypothetical protein
VGVAEVIPFSIHHSSFFLNIGRFTLDLVPRRKWFELVVLCCTELLVSE